MESQPSTIDNTYCQTLRYYIVEYTDSVNQRRQIKIRQRNEECAIWHFQRQVQEDYDWISPCSK